MLNSMALQLNESPEVFKAFPQVGFGRNIEQMPWLTSEGRTPLSVADLMRVRLDATDGTYGFKQSWFENYFDCGDVVAYHPDGKFKIDLDSDHLRNVNPNSNIMEGSLVLPDGTYDMIDGLEFKMNEIDRYLKENPSQANTKENPIWQALARGDKSLLSDYIDMIFAGREIHGWHWTLGPKLSCGPVEKGHEILSHWSVNGVIWGSSLWGRTSLNANRGRLVGILR